MWELLMRAFKPTWSKCALKRYNLTLRKWSKDGTPAQQNVLKLLHAMNQQFTDEVTKPIMAMVMDQSPNSPGSILDIGKVDIDLKHGTKKVEYEFGPNDVEVTNTFTIEAKKDGKVQAELMQKTVLTAKLSNLSDWH